MADQIYKKKKGLSERRLGDEVMLYDQEADKVHILNQTGAILWNLLDGEKSLQEIEDYFLRQFPDIKKDDLSKDIKEIIERLKEEGLICS